MIKRSITNKLTFIMVLLMSLLLLASMLFMAYSFETYYTRTKKAALAENLETFKKQTPSSAEGFIEAINTFETANGTRLFIFGQNGVLQYMAYGGTRIDGDYIEIINRFFSDLVSDQDLAQSMLVQGKVISREYSRQDGSIRYFLTVSAMPMGSETSIALSISSLYPINEAARTIRNFFVYVFFGGFAVVLTLAFFISRTITRPLRKLTASSKELAQLNFDVGIDGGTQDEIGELSTSLSTLAQNLKSALQELKEKNELLEQDIEKSQKLETLRKEFIRDISHELKTPITLIEGYAEGLLDGIGENSQQEYLEIILDEAKNMEKLVKDMIEVSYAESEAFSLKITEFSLDQVLKEALAPFQEYQSKDVDFTLDILPGVLIQGDVLKVGTALRNIIKNGISYCDPLPGKKKAMAIRLFEEAEGLKLILRNSPAHIEEEDLQNIWIPFYKKDKSRHRQEGSTGLGLSIIRNVLEKHHWAYTLENDGDGVAFTIVFQNYRRG